MSTICFSRSTSAAILKACEKKQTIEFEVEQSATAFEKTMPPVDWTAYPPAALPSGHYDQLGALAGTDTRGELTRLELSVHQDGGRILYRATGQGRVALRVTWPGRT